MSAILDALKKSETDRQKGNTPDFASGQMLMTGKKKSLPVWVWVVVALLVVNLLVVLAFFLYTGGNTGELVQPNQPFANSTPHNNSLEQAPVAPLERPRVVVEPPPREVFLPEIPPNKGVEVSKPVNKNSHQVETESELAKRAAAIAFSNDDDSAGDDFATVESSPDDYSNEVPEQYDNQNLATPSVEPVPDTSETIPKEVNTTPEPGSDVLYLTEMERSFQQSIPGLVFNSHIFASDPSRRRIMINDEYLSQGQRVSGLMVEEITKDGVVLSKDGTLFKLSVVRNWSFQ